MNAIVAVGGTGKRVALLYLKMINTLRPANVTTPPNFVFVVDMNPLPNTPDARLNEELQGQGVPASNFITPVNEDMQVNPAIRLSSFLGLGTGNQISPVARVLFDSNQRNVQVAMGMNCEPTVGATVAAQRFKTTEDSEEDVQSLQARLMPSVHLIVVGSMIGGTGSGVTPQLVKWMRKRIPGRPIHGLLFMRWIDLPQNDAEGPNNVKMSGNQRAWLNYLIEHHRENPHRQQEDLFDHYVLVGAPDAMSLSDSRSSENHPLHMLGAAYLLQFDNFLLQNPGATGAHYLELATGIQANELKMGDHTMEGALIREMLAARLLGNISAQRPDESMSWSTLMMPEAFAWRPFIRTLEKIVAKRGRYRQRQADWRLMTAEFDREKRQIESRIEEIRGLTSRLGGAHQIFDFDWNKIEQQAENHLASSARKVEKELSEVVVAAWDDNGVREAASNFIKSLRAILRNLTI